MKQLKLPILCNTRRAIRLEIGGKGSIDDRYIAKALARAETIYNSLPNKPDILRIDTYPDKNNEQNEIDKICSLAQLPMPNEQIMNISQWDVETATELQLYWDLTMISFTPALLLQQIIEADMVGYNGLSSNVYFADSRKSILYHLYDDRGVDLAAEDKEIIRWLYKRFKSWVLDYDNELMDPTLV